MAPPSRGPGRTPPVLLLSTLTPIALVLIGHPLLPLLLPSKLVHALTERIPLPPQPTFPALQANIGFSLLAFVGAILVVPEVGDAFIAKGLKGRDMLKPGGRISGPWIPECLGLPIASLYILLMMLFIPFPFSHLFQHATEQAFPKGELALYLTSLLSLLTATLLGFIDDLFDIRWRHKLPIPFIAAVPTLLVYYSEGGQTSVVLPASAGKLLQWLNLPGIPGYAGNAVVDLGFFYYVYLLMLPTFTTNAINIIAGVNGVEVLQGLIIALSVGLNDLLFLPLWPTWLLRTLNIGNPEEGRVLAWAAGEVVTRHLMSLYFMMPLIGVTAGFLYHNWYPARAFPGDTLCYFTGMAFSAVAIQGHFSKTLLLFFVPQVVNFILSCPQLFHLVPCPRHRLPHYNPETGLLEPSRAIFDSPPPFKTRFVLQIMEALRLTRLERTSDAPATQAVEGKKVNGSSKQAPVKTPNAKTEHYITSCTNLTILNLLLVHRGPMKEATLCTVFGGVQVACSAAAFGVRYGVGSLVYGGDRR